MLAFLWRVFRRCERRAPCNSKSESAGHSSSAWRWKTLITSPGRWHSNLGDRKLPIPKSNSVDGHMKSTEVIRIQPLCHDKKVGPFAITWCSFKIIHYSVLQPVWKEYRPIKVLRVNSVLHSHTSKGPTVWILTLLWWPWARPFAQLFARPLEGDVQHKYIFF
jgi:hypothetical protein